MNVRLAGAALLIATQCVANDSYVKVVGGSPQALEEHVSISMVDERISMTIFPSSYTIHADFKFFNNGASTNVTVGFPVDADYGEDNPDANFLGFKTWVNGREVPTDTLRHKQEELGDFPALWKTKQVFFPERKYVTTSVEYAAQFGGVAGGGSTAGYVYGTGRTWSGSIRRAIFEIRFDESLLIVPPCGDKFSLVGRSNGKMVFEMQGIKPANLYDGIGTRFINLDAMVNMHDEHNIAIDGFLLGKDRYCFSRHDENECRFRKARMISEGKLNAVEEYGCNGDLKYLTLAQLRLLRNAVFAKRGRIFKDEQLARFFRTQNWYKPNESASMDNLIPDEKEWLNRVSKQEQSLLGTK